MTLDRLREVFDLDEATGVLRWRAKPSRFARSIKVGDVAGGSPNSHGYLHVQLDGKQLKVHRVVFALANGFWPEQVDHVNGVKTDNRPDNLRAATNAENGCNVGLRADNASGFKGVSWHKRDSKWRAQCRVDGRKHHVGYFTDKDAAAAAVQTFREKHHKEFARHD